MHLKMIERRASERRSPAGPNRSDGGEMERMTECLAGFWVTPSAGLPARCPCPAAPSSGFTSAVFPATKYWGSA